MIKHHIYGSVELNQLDINGGEMRVIIDFDVELSYAVQIGSIIRPGNFVKAFDEANFYGATSFDYVMAYESMYSKDWVVDRCECMSNFIDVHLKLSPNSTPNQ